MNEPLLAIETTGRVLSVALHSKYGDVAERRSSGYLSHLTDLMPTVSELLASGGVELASLGAIAVSAGPGSFTGIRIGVSAVRAMAQVTGLPVIEVPTLETFVYGYGPGDIVCPMLDARRGQWYCGAYRLACKPGGIETFVPGAARDAEEFEAILAVALRASGAEDAPRRYVRDGDEPQSAAKVLKWARDLGNTMSYALLEPIYMRKATAQERLDAKTYT
ncbi:MAG: tRNA (adenosine(37)-N6)-threonylcarbamoyltransferase complex dimerization subunit type 1 TsaB [Clostridiales Family XIII bacterium]|jgi:tRNA threonylcarbamoyl adenosine modification protein YeaZ|nr:tRNA (adenosine(37)-N6)-threonylcarbamoyltransferase complex dimerization subunit type 1 TsaB [Clostridiales Family XIII bacterium]